MRCSQGAPLALPSGTLAGGTGVAAVRRRVEHTAVAPQWDAAGLPLVACRCRVGVHGGRWGGVSKVGWVARCCEEQLQASPGVDGLLSRVTQNMPAVRIAIPSQPHRCRLGTAGRSSHCFGCTGCPPSGLHACGRVGKVRRAHVRCRVANLYPAEHMHACNSRSSVTPSKYQKTRCSNW